MLGKPNCGWSHIKIGNTEFGASYLTDVPNDLLTNFINLYDFKCDTVATRFDCEGYEYYLISEEINSVVFEMKYDKVIVVEERINTESLVVELIKDIESNFDDWIDWLPTSKNDERYKQEHLINENKLKENLNKLKKVMYEYNVEFNRIRSNNNKS